MIRHEQYTSLDPKLVKQKLEEFFIEDNISQDITTKSTQAGTKSVTANFVAKEDLIFAGKEIINQAFVKECSIENIINDGVKINKGDSIATLTGPINIVLQKERVVLNLIQRLSGIASTALIEPHRSRKLAHA